MKHPSTTFTRRRPKTYVAALLTYVLLAGQVAPLALAGARAHRPRAGEAHAGGAAPAEAAPKVAPLPVPVPAPAAAAATLVVTKVDSFADPDMDGKADPGQTITYTVTIQNTGNMDATNVTMTDTVDPNTTIVGGSVVASPLGSNDTYNVIGNVRIQPNSAQGVLANDRDTNSGNTGAGAGLTASGPNTGPSNGQLTLNSDGSFSYNPNAGFNGSDSFTYTVTDSGGRTGTATVTLNVGDGNGGTAGAVWFVDPAASPGGDGRLTNPFNCFVGTDCFDDTTLDEAGESIFLYAGAHTGGQTLLNNQKLVGQGATATLASISGYTVQAYSDPLPANNSLPGSVTVATTAAATNAVTLGQGNTLRGFTISNTTGAKIFGNNFGTLVAGNSGSPDVVLSSTGQALNLTNGTLSVAGGFVSVSTTSSTSQGINLSGIADSDGAGGSAFSFGSTTVSGSTTQGILVGTTTADINFGNTDVSGGTDGISLQNNSSGTRTFGTLARSGGTGVGFLHANGGGTVNVAGATTITNPAGIGIQIQSSTTAVTFAATTVTKDTTAGVGVSLGSNSGNTTFSNLAVTTSNGAGLVGTENTGQINVTNAAGSQINATAGASVDITKAANPATPIALNFTSLSSSNSAAQGLRLNRVSGGGLSSGATTAGGATGPASEGLSVTNATATTLSFGNTNSTASAGIGVFLSNNASPISFASLNIAPDSGVVAFGTNTNTGTVSSTSGTISTTNAAAINVTATPLNMALTSVSANISSGTAQSGVSLLNATGTLTMNGGTITGGGAAAFHVSGGTVNSTYAGTVSQANAQRVVNVDGTTGGTVSFTGTVSGTASTTGVNINNANGNVSFTTLNLGTSGARLTNQAVTITNGTGAYSLGAVSIFTNNANGINATNADGTINSTSGTVDSSNATAVNIDGPGGITTLGMTLTRVDSAGGTAAGIALQETGGGFTVVGDGSNTAVGGNGSGGTISNKSGATGTANGNGVFMSNVSGVTLRRMTINGTNQNHGVRGVNTSNFTMEFVTVSGTNGEDAATDEGSVNFSNLTGAAAITSCVIEGGFEDNLSVVNTSGTLNRLVITGSTFGNNSTTLGNNNIRISSNGSAVLNWTLRSSTIKGAKTDWINTAANGTSTMDLIIGGPNVADGNTFDSIAFPHPAPAPGGNRVVTGAIGTHTIDIRNNTMKGAKGEAIRIRGSAETGQTGTVNARVRNNIIGDAAVANSGSSEGSGIYIFGDGGSDMNVAVTGNTIRQYNNHGIRMDFGDEINEGSVFNVTVTGNSVNTPGTINTDFNAIHLNNGTIAATDNFTTCADIGGAGALMNSVAGGGKGATPPNNADIRLRQRQSTTVRLPGYGGANNNDAAVVTYLQGRNTLSTAAASNTVPTGGGFVGGAACTQPTVAAAPELAEIAENTNSGEATGSESTTESRSNNVTNRPFVSFPVITQSQPGSQGGELTVVNDSPDGSAPSTQGAPPVSDTTVGDDNGGTGDDLPAPQPPVIMGDTITFNLGTIPAGKSVTVTFQVTVDDPFNGASQQVSNQATVTADGGINVVSDDPTEPGANDPTVTPINVPQTVFSIRDAKVGEPASGTTPMVFNVVLPAPASGTVTVDYATADDVGGTNPATGGASCDGSSDYVTSSGTVTFSAGQMMRTISVDVCSDGNNGETDETFLVNLSNPSSGTILDGQAVGTINPTSQPGLIVISEVRTSGPGGAGDDFVELFNNTGTDHTVAASDASAGYGLFKMGSGCDATPILVGTIPNGTVIPKKGHYLFGGSAYSLANYGGTTAAAPNQTLSSDIEDDADLAIFTTADVAQVSTANRFDGIGFGANTGSVCDLLREGTTMPAALGSTSEYSFVRKPDTLTGNPLDTNVSASDFIVVSTTPATPVGDNATPRLGAPGPEGLASPTVKGLNTDFGSFLVAPCVAAANAPNRVRDNTPGDPATSSLGTLAFRRTYLNLTGGPVTRLRFRIIDMTTFPSPSGTADLRAITSSQVVVSNPCGGGNLTVEGTTLETPPAQPNGGGINSTLSAGTVTLATPLAHNQSINLQFLTGVQQTGNFRFMVVIEALP
ncbi:MAG TPA: Ig-like domain-containing protein [Pyrinomonadaceae bacterium]|nr:Ig-like domain-containing protein [Pyrinomonadaceae bacterium]